MIPMLLVAVIIDYITGLIAGMINGELSSEVGFKGILRKIIIFSIVVAAHFIDVVLSTGEMIRNATVIFYLCNEILSILENAGKAGLPLPPSILEKIQALKNRSNNKE
ncbi:holin [Falsibacillus albus]|uniref:Holin n=2 Tax=Falsibacillus albus TaxID=2478915 RepID=A0A3L7K6S8_9BACI|nr:holin [Falsibacillus albus]